MKLALSLVVALGLIGSVAVAEPSSYTQQRRNNSAPARSSQSRETSRPAQTYRAPQREARSAPVETRQQAPQRAERSAPVETRQPRQTYNNDSRVNENRQTKTNRETNTNRDNNNYNRETNTNANRDNNNRETNVNRETDSGNRNSNVNSNNQRKSNNNNNNRQTNVNNHPTTINNNRTTNVFNSSQHQSTYVNNRDGATVKRAGTTSVRTYSRPDSQGRTQVVRQGTGVNSVKTTTFSDGHRQIIAGGTTKTVYSDHTDIVRGNVNVRETKVDVSSFHDTRVTNSVMLQSRVINNTRIDIHVNNYVTRTFSYSNYNYGYAGGWVHNYGFINYRPFGWRFGFNYSVYVPVWDPAFHPFWYNAYYVPTYYGWYTNGPWRFHTYLPWSHYTYCWYGCSTWIGPVYHWNAYYGYYYRPYPFYRGPAFWLTDFFISDILETAYQARLAEQAQLQAEQQQEASDQASELAAADADQVTDAQADIADAQAQAQQEAQANSAVVNNTNTAIDQDTQQQLTEQTQDVTDALKNQTAVQLGDLITEGKIQNYKFVVHNDINAATLGSDGQPDGLSCSLSEGDIIQLAPGIQVKDGDTTAKMLVVTSKEGDCKPAVAVTVTLEDMQGMLNDFTTRVEQGMKVMKDKGIGSN